MSFSFTDPQPDNSPHFTFTGPDPEDAEEQLQAITAMAQEILRLVAVLRAHLSN